jgi:peptidoglycan/xylan/chitin deacetylase (PgdA/CDA1 family)/GT2 family glycosyltransferase
MSVKLSVVVPTYNRRRVLERTLPLLLAQDFPGDQWEIVVVVDGSTDGTTEYLRSLNPGCKLTIIEQPNRGQAAARNAGVEAAHGELILLMDDDHICARTIVAGHVAAHSGRGSCVVFGHVFLAPQSPRTLAADYIGTTAQNYAATLEQQGGPLSGYEVWISSNCSLPRTLFCEIGGYDETLYRSEDDDLAIRLWEAGVPFKFDPDLITLQYYVKTTTEFVNNTEEVDGKNEVRTSRKHPSYRGLSPLASLLKPSAPARLAAWSLCNSPISPDMLLRPLCFAAERLISVDAIRHAGRELLNRRIQAALLRGAVREAGSWTQLKREFGVCLPVLLYHHVGPLRPGTNPELTVTPEMFESQMRWLARRGYVGIRPADWMAWCCHREPLPEKPVLITLDDGYADSAEHALPLLRHLGFGAAVYVVTGRLGSSGDWSVQFGFKPHALMNADQVRYWAQHGIDFGAHTRTHPDLTTLDEQRLADEVEGSADDLARLVGHRPASFAYPFGIYDDRVRERVSRSFDLALTCNPGFNSLSIDLHEMRRAEIGSGDGLAKFVWRVNRGGFPLSGVRERLRLRTRGKSAIRKLRAAAGF